MVKTKVMTDQSPFSCGYSLSIYIYMRIIYDSLQTCKFLFVGSSHFDPLRTCLGDLWSPGFLSTFRMGCSGTRITCGTSFMEETPSYGLWQVVSQFVTRGRKPRQRAWKSAEAPVGKPCFWIFLGPIALHIVTLLKLGNFRHPPCAGSTCSVYIYICAFFFYWYRGTIYRYDKIW